MLFALAFSLTACKTGVPGPAGPPVVSEVEIRPAPEAGGDRFAAALPARAAPAAANVAVTIGPQVRVDKGGDSFTIETAALTTEDNPSEVLAAWYDSRQIPGTPPTLTRLAMARSQDGGATWSETLLDVPAELLSRVAGDPMFAHDPRTGTMWLGGVSLGANPGVFIYRRDSGTAGFGPAIKVWKDPLIDKPLMAAGVDPQDSTKTRLYVTHNLGLQVSADLGATWSAPAPLGDYVCFQPRTGPNGELYIVYWDLADGILIRRSLDGGRTLEPPVRVATRRDFWPVQQIGVRFPGKFRVPPFTYLAVDPRDGALYVVYFDTTSVTDGRWDVDLYLTKSTDRGVTWSPPRVINGDGDPPGDQFFPWIEVDRQGRVHIVFYDTRHTDQEDGSAAALVDAYYAVSTDGGATWSEHRLTPAPFSSGAPYPSWLASQFLGDYNGLSVAGNRAYPVYMSTQNGNADIFAHAIDLGGVETCVSGGEDLCLNGGRFRVRAAWETPRGERGTGRAVQLTADSGYFWFFEADNVEAIVKVLDACARSQHYWVFSTGLTNVGVRLTVEDLRTGAVKEYVNPASTPYAPRLDTSAFRTCGTS
ncbi:MAG TPA: hypothetical protein VF756_05230 [Thermoanaerobaculia bacterium]